MPSTAPATTAQPCARDDETLTAAETARLLKALGFNWLDIECVLVLAPHRKSAGHTRYARTVLERFIVRAIWLSETPLRESLPAAA